MEAEVVEAIAVGVERLEAYPCYGWPPMVAEQTLSQPTGVMVCPGPAKLIVNALLPMKLSPRPGPSYAARSLVPSPLKSPTVTYSR